MDEFEVVGESTPEQRRPEKGQHSRIGFEATVVGSGKSARNVSTAISGVVPLPAAPFMQFLCDAIEVPFKTWVRSASRNSATRGWGAVGGATA